MPPAVHAVLVVGGLIFLLVGMYHRLRAARSGDKLDHTKETWPILIGIRLTGFLSFGSTVLWIWKPGWFAWAAYPVPDWVRWTGVAGFLFGITWLIWMFFSLGSNLTDTVETRREAYFVEQGPYRYVRNPMYTGILMVSASLGLALGTWLVPVAGLAMFLLLAKRTRIEETYLIARFGQQYRDYMKRVGRFFPRFSE